MKIMLTPSVLRWARTRAGLTESQLAEKLGLPDPSAITEWERNGEITLARAEQIAKYTHTSIGYLFLSRPPHEELPIKDFRRIGDHGTLAISPDLLDVIYDAQRRQAWYREHLVENGANPLPFVGSVTIETPQIYAAEKVVSGVKIGHSISESAKTWQENLGLHIEAMEDAGITVMRSGVVRNSNKRRLDLNDFRGFALCDSYAPVIFINSQDSIAAQLFTIVHEVSHIFLGESAVFNLDDTYAQGQIEEFCNGVAAEVLLPLASITAGWRESADPYVEIRRFAKRFKVSSLVSARRAKDAGFLTDLQFRTFYREEIQRLRPVRNDDSNDGGNFYNTLNARVGGRLVRAIIASTLEGKTLYTEAMRLLGLRNSIAIGNLAKSFGYAH